MRTEDEVRMEAAETLGLTGLPGGVMAGVADTLYGLIWQFSWNLSLFVWLCLCWFLRRTREGMMSTRSRSAVVIAERYRATGIHPWPCICYLSSAIRLSILSNIDMVVNMKPVIIEWTMCLGPTL